MHTPQRRTHSPVLLVTIATVPLLLAALTVWMVREALSHHDSPTERAASTVTSQTSGR